MTEAEWLGCTDPRRMMNRLRGRAVTRKLQLFIGACLRRVGIACQDCPAHAVEMIEAYADGTVNENELRTAWYRASLPPCLEPQRMAWCIAGMNRKLVSLVAWRVRRTKGTAADDEMAPQCHFIRDIFGNPFLPVTINPAWLTPTVTDLAQAAYDERIMPSGELEPDRLAVLSDALEEAGCDNADILAHLRSSGPHVRGCWVLDLLLGKE